MTRTYKYLGLTAVITALVLVSLAIIGGSSLRAIAETIFTMQPETNNWQYFTFFNATTTTATSTNQLGGGGSAIIAGAKKVSLMFSRGDTKGSGNAGSSLFTVQVSQDGSDWVYYNKLIDNVTNTNGQTITRVSSSSLTGTTTKTYDLDLSSGTYRFVRCIATEATDGEHTCKAAIEF